VSELPYRAVCGNCGRIERFSGVDAAFQAGWDTPDRFGYTACSNCPGMSVYFALLRFQEAREARTDEEREAKLQEAYAGTTNWDPAGRGGPGWQEWQEWQRAHGGGES
jgi:hypothetical protein